jgi:Uma2 family endonuclease
VTSAARIIAESVDGASMLEAMAETATTVRAGATEADLLRTPQDGRKYELVDGKIRVSPAGMRHGQVIVRLTLRIAQFVQERGLGHVFESSTGFRLPGGNVRSPDVSFVRTGRFENERPPDDFADLAPDLAVEVLSPGDTPRHMLDKVGEYLQSGVALVWVIDPQRERGAVYRSLTDVRELRREGFFDGEDVVPGFSVELADLLG